MNATQVTVTRIDLTTEELVKIARVLDQIDSVAARISEVNTQIEMDPMIEHLKDLTNELNELQVLIGFEAHRMTQP